MANDNTIHIIYSKLYFLLKFCETSALMLQYVQCMCISQLLLNRFSPLFLPTEIGLGLTGFGVLFSFLGIIMLFDKGFLAMGNVRMICSFELFGFILDSSVLFTENNCCLSCCQILFASGVLLTIGLKPTVQFFTKPKNHKVLILSLQTQAIPVPFLFSANK